MFNEFLEYINNVKSVFQLVNVIFSINIDSNFTEVIKQKDSNFIVFKVENKGCDVHSFLESIKYIRKYNIKTDYILKLHTKESNNFSEGLLNWRKELINPITNVENLKIIQHYFKKVKNIGYVGSQKCVLPKNFDFDFQHNIDGINNLCNKFPHLEKQWTDFIGGNIFWINYEVVNEYLTDKLINYLTNNIVYGKPPNNLKNKGVYFEYLCERIFTGIFCYNKTNILVNEFQGTNRGISYTNGSIDNTYFYQPSVFSFHIPKNIVIN
jgi:hypothetical protein